VAIKKKDWVRDFEAESERILSEEMGEYGLDSRAYFRNLRERLTAADPHYIKGKNGKWVMAYATPAWKIRQDAGQELAPQVGIKKPADEHELTVNQPVVVQIVEQPGCPELPRKGKNGTDAT
jgi:hypothetical protein